MQGKQGGVSTFSPVSAQIWTTRDVIDWAIYNFAWDILSVAKLDCQKRVYLSSWAISVQMVEMGFVAVI